MKKSVVDTATQTVLNVIVVDPLNLPTLSTGTEFRDEIGAIGQIWSGTEWEWSTEDLAAQIRAERNARLVEDVDPLTTSVLIWEDVAEADKAAWTTYRHELLNIPQQAGFPNTVVWPTRPV